MAKRRQPAALRRYWAKHRHKGKKHNAPRKRRRARRNWTNTGAMVPVNRPKRRYHRRYRMNPHHRRRHHRRNPVFGGFYFPPVRTVAFGALGFVSPPLVSGFLTTMAPSIMQVAANAGLIGKYAVKIGTVAIASWLTRRFVSQADGNAVAIGGGINVGISLMYDFAPGILPANPLSAYVPVRAGLKAYVPTRAGLRAVPRQRMSTIAGGQPAIFPSGTATNVGANSMWGPALRYQRY